MSFLAEKDLQGHSSTVEKFAEETQDFGDCGDVSKERQKRNQQTKFPKHLNGIESKKKIFYFF